MMDLCRLISWMVVDLIRSRVMLEAEIWTLRQQINVLRRTTPKKLRKQQIPRQMIGRWSLQHALPPCAQTFEIETAQMGDLVLNRCLGRDTTIATLLPHRIRPPASLDRWPRTKPCYP